MMCELGPNVESTAFERQTNVLCKKKVYIQARAAPPSSHFENMFIDLVDPVCSECVRVARVFFFRAVCGRLSFAGGVIA